jgi:1,4-alpha-glucan branching enzyme
VRPVTFELRRSAQEVFLAGTFNNWNPNVTPMILIGDDLWVKELSLPPGTYEYLFVVDGAWIPDPRARGSVPNPYGGYNSLVRVG